MTKDEALKMAIDTLQNAKREHFYCEDTYYSCPKHEDGCADDRQPDECNCGADKLNAEIDMSTNACKEALEQPAQETVGWNEEEFNEIAYAYRICPAHKVNMVSERYQDLVAYVLSLKDKNT